MRSLISVSWILQAAKTEYDAEVAPMPPRKWHAAVQSSFRLSKALFYSIWIKQWKNTQTRMWANAQRDGRLPNIGGALNAAKFGWRPLLDAVQ